MASKEKKEVFIPKTPADLQRMKLEKLMKNPDKLAAIPDGPKDRKHPNAPEFVRDVMGSSAGAGSGEFHVYRGYRRRELFRQKHLDEHAKKESERTEFEKKLDANKQAAEEKTAKKRAKRQKKKMKKKMKKQEEQKDTEEEKKESESEEEEEQEEEEPDQVKEDDGEENCFVIGGR
ncbi:PRKRIP1 [Branchiostoma lanceolatum]|uniref:PRKRIP1 protein n=1 Tax=Branchiostoma lanceolatum TaxID=7740 RepID=A0A8J9VD90_BRALA|nr:PRKRIP1 [Branchiostoma lanceolatum]